MKAIFTYPIMLFTGMMISFSSSSQNCSTVQPNVAACDNVVENFNSGAGGFLGTNLAHTSNNFSTVLSNNVSPATLSIISPAYYKLGTMPNTVMAGYTMHVGFKVTITSITLQVLDAMNADAVIAACQQAVSITNIQTSICMSVTSAAINTGMMLKYRFVFVAEIDPGGNNSQNSVELDNFSTALGQNAALPVKFGVFQARSYGSTVLLNWKMDTEENTALYAVERSADGKNFSTIGAVAARGAAEYNYTDLQPLMDGYYRIRAMDYDEKISYSVVVRMKGNETAAMTKTFWRQKNILVVQHEVPTGGSMIEVMASDGRLVSKTTANPGTQETLVDVSSAAPGLIIVRLISPGQRTEIIKLVKN